MKACINTIQDITLDAYILGIHDIYEKEYIMPRDDIFAIYQNWAEEFEVAHEDYLYDGDYYDEIDKFLKQKKRDLQ